MSGFAASWTNTTTDESHRPMKIIDTHTHFYDPSRPQGVPWPGPEEKLIYRTVLPEHHREVAAPSGVVGTVVTAASVWLEDNQWVLDQVDRSDRWIRGVVGHLDADADFGKNVDRFAANPYYRGIRAGADFVDDADGRALERAEKMAEHDLQVDICGTTDRPEAVCAVAHSVPELRWVLNHCGEPRIDGEAPDPAWVDYVRAVGEIPQIYCKVSGLVEYSVTKPAPSELDYYLPVLEVLWEAFGEDRLIYGSNWPVCDLNSDHETVQAIVRRFFEPKGEAALEKYWWKNAKAAYKYVDTDDGSADR